MKKKIFTVIVIMIIIFFIFINNSYANVLDDLGDLDKYRGPSVAPVNFIDKIGTVVSIIQIVGVLISVVVLILIGLKYMLGSLEERAEYKKTMIPYLIGAVLVFSVTTIPQIIYMFVKNI